MSCPLFNRPAVAILAAYAIALQTLLLAFTAPMPAGSLGLLTVICSDTGSANDGQPAPPLRYHLYCTACMASGCAMPPPAYAGIAVPVGVELAALSVKGTPGAYGSEPARTRPQSPRAPPLGA